jgi:hypothetical protein
MSDMSDMKRRRGDERLLLTCLALERLCAEHVPAAVRLEAEIGPVNMQRLVVALAPRLTAQKYSDRHLHDAACIGAAA